MKEVIAFFDLDGTITKKDTFIDFIIFVRGKFDFYKGLIVLSPYILLYFIKLYPNYKLKEKFFSFYLSSFNVDKLNQLGKQYSLNRLPALIYENALNRIKWHREKNHQVVILTASSSLWLEYWCKKNNLELIGTVFEISNDKYTGKILGKNCYGIEKKEIVNMILSKNKYIDTYGYGNTKSDLFFLNLLINKHYKFFS